MKTYTVKIDDEGTKRWYADNNLHREDGPAIEYANGYKAWFLNGENLIEKEFNKRINKILDPEVKVIEIDGVRYELKKLD